MEQPTLYKETKRRARKAHTCTNCGDTIPRGYTYVSISGCWDGEMKSYKHCNCCDNVMKDWWFIHDATGWTEEPSGPYMDFGGVAQFLQESLYWKCDKEEVANQLASDYNVPVEWVRRRLNMQ